jgi:hypothetical protein
MHSTTTVGTCGRLDPHIPNRDSFLSPSQFLRFSFTGVLSYALLPTTT